MTDVSHDPASQRVSIETDGDTGYLEYERIGEVMMITHTIVPARIGGRGIAGRLVQAAVEFARAEGMKVVPQCSYAEAWMRRHPEFEGLRA